MEKLLQWDADLLLAINSHHTAFWDQVMWYSSQSWVWIPLYLLLGYAVYKVSCSLQFDKLRIVGLGNPQITGSGKQHTATTEPSAGLKVFVVVLLGVVLIGAAAGLSDFITSGILKKWICRPRPTHSDLADYLHIVRDYRGGHYGFPSSHAANTFAVATTFWFIINYLNSLPHECVAHRAKDVGAVQRLERVMKVVVVLYVVLNCYSRMYLGVHYPLDILCGAIIGSLLGYLCAQIYKVAVKIE